MFVNSDTKIIEIINKIGPEHLELNVKNYKSFVPKIKKCWISLSRKVCCNGYDRL